MCLVFLQEKELFDRWNEKKKQVQLSAKEFYFKERDVFYMHMGKNIGYEQNGKGESFLRPVLVVKKFNKDSFWGVPLTTQEKRGKYYYDVSFSDIKSIAILSQLKLYSTKRLMDKIGKVSAEKFTEMKEKIKNLLE